MKYKISFKKSVLKDLKKIDKNKIENILNAIETELSEKANENPVLKGKFSGLRKYRFGNYRIIYTILNKDTVLILRKAHRKEVYKK